MKINDTDYANGLCICFDCADVHTCAYRSRYARQCNSFVKKHKAKK